VDAATAAASLVPSFSIKQFGIVHRSCEMHTCVNERGDGAERGTGPISCSAKVHPNHYIIKPEPCTRKPGI